LSPRDEIDAKEWVKNAIAFYKSSGRRIALAAFTVPRGMFVHDEVYIYVLNSKGIMLAHGENEKFVGADFIEITDCDGKKFIRDIVEIANAAGSGWVGYKWHHPACREWLPKTAYFEKVDDLIIVSAVTSNRPEAVSVPRK